VTHLVQYPPGQLPGELPTALLAAALEIQAVVTGFPHVVQEGLGCQIGQRDALRRQRRGDIEQRGTMVQRMNRGVLDTLPQLLSTSGSRWAVRNRSP
jgi:hypothetical protein